MTATASEAIADRVLRHPFFVDIDPTLVHAMVSKAEERSYDVGEMLVHEGRPAEEFFLVIEGKIALEVGAGDRPGITVETIEKGEILGWSWLVAPYRWRFDARASKPTKVIAINAAAPLTRSPPDRSSSPPGRRRRPTPSPCGWPRSCRETASPSRAASSTWSTFSAWESPRSRSAETPPTPRSSSTRSAPWVKSRTRSPP